MNEEGGTDFKAAIREYLEVSDVRLREELRDGLISVAEAKEIAAEMTKWQELLAMLEAADILYGDPK
jgi:hypothetical protein